MTIQDDGTLQISCGGALQKAKSFREKKGKAGVGRPNYADRGDVAAEAGTTTCCPPIGIEDAPLSPQAKPWRFNQGPNPFLNGNKQQPGWNDWTSAGVLTHRVQTCFRGLFGVTSNCNSTFKLKILKCRGCTCTHPHNANSGTTLVYVDTSHGLATNAGACKMWYTYADDFVRSLVADSRAKLVQEKAATCGA